VPPRSKCNKCAQLLLWLKQKLLGGQTFDNAKDLQHQVKTELNIDVSLTKARIILKEQLGYSYKAVHWSHNTSNSEVAKLKRQYAAHRVVQMLDAGTEIINIDESSICTTNYSRKSWSLKGVHNVSTDATRLGNFNVIAAISSLGRSTFVVGNGSNN
jgi:hypothetical protein